MSESEELELNATLRRIKENDPSLKSYPLADGDDDDDDYVQNMTDEDWEELGRDI